MTEPDPDGQFRPVEREEVVTTEGAGIRAARIANALIRVICGVFAAILVIYVVLVLGNANFGNPFAQLINNWAAAVSLGLRDLFTPANENARIALNNGLAAALWLLIGAVLSSLIGRITAGAERRVRYRRSV
jgi:hypothetical protein